ncbi:MAG: hypothetical protein PVSMB7_22240 [Chloroflexota bacterium]
MCSKATDILVVLILFCDAGERLHARGMVQFGQADDGTPSLRSIKPRQQELQGPCVAGPSERSRGMHIMTSAINKHRSSPGRIDLFKCEQRICCELTVKLPGDGRYDGRVIDEGQGA